jgi:hypothetical protein
MKKDYMKFIILLLITFPVFACQINIPTSEAQRYIDAMPNGVPPLYSCADKPDEECLCADSIIWEEAEIIDIEVLDYISKENVQACELLIEPESIEGEEPKPFSKYQDCDDKFTALVCDKGEAVKNYDELEVYCVKNVMKTEKKLVNSPVKKAAHEALKTAKEKEIKDKESKINAAKEALKNADIDGATTIAKLKVIVKALLEAQE